MYLPHFYPTLSYLHLLLWSPTPCLITELFFFNIYICLHILKNMIDIPCPIIISYIYMCLWLNTWDWVINLGFIFGEVKFSLSQQFWLLDILNLGVGPCDISPTHVDMSTDIIILQVLFWWLYCWDFMDAASFSYREDIILQQTLLFSGSDSLFTPSSAMFLEPKIWEFYCRCIN